MSFNDFDSNFDNFNLAQFCFTRDCLYKDFRKTAGTAFALAAGFYVLIIAAIAVAVVLVINNT